MPVFDHCGTDQSGPSARIHRRSPLHDGVTPRALRGGVGLRAAGAPSTMGTMGRVLVMLRVTWDGAEETSNPKTLALQGSQGDRRGRAASRWAGGAHGERASEGHRA